MIKMIRADLYRLARSKALIVPVLLMLYVLTVSLITILPAYIGTTFFLTQASCESVLPEEYIKTLEEHSYAELSGYSVLDVRKIILSSDYKYDVSALGINCNLVYIVLAIAAVAVINDYSHGCIKNTLSSNISRKKYFAAKSLFVNAMSLVSISVFTFLIFICNRIVNGAEVSAGAFNVLKSLMLQMPAFLAIVSIYILEAYLIRHSVIYYITAILTPSLFSVFYCIGNNSSLDFFMKYEPITIMMRVINEPSDGYLIKSTLVCAGIIIFCYTLSYRVFSKLEIK